MLKKYLLKDLSSNLILSVVVLSFVLVSIKLADAASELLKLGASAKHFLLLSFYLFLYTLPYTTSLALLTSVFLTSMRLAQTNELLALFSLGISPGRLIRPLLFLCVATFSLNLVLHLWVFPWGARGTKRVGKEVVIERLKKGIEAKSPVTFIPGLLIYAEETPDGFSFKHIYLLKKTGTQVGVIFAERGRYELQNETVTLKLFKGEAHFLQKEGDGVQDFYFGTYIYRRAVEVSSGRGLSREELPTSELLHRLDERSYRTELYKRIFFPVASLILPFYGLFLGTRLRGTGRLTVVLAASLLFFLYYLLFTFVISLSDEGKLHPLFGFLALNMTFFLPLIKLKRRFEEGGFYGRG